MMMAMKMEQSALLSEEERMDPPPKKLMETVAQKHAVEISQTQAMAAGMGVHMGYSALWGAIYGIVQDRLRPPDVLHGLLLGGLVYAANFPEWGLLPRVGALPPPSAQEPVQAAIPMVAHAVLRIDDREGVRSAPLRARLTYTPLLADAIPSCTHPHSVSRSQ